MKYLNRDQVVALAEAVSDHYNMAPPSVTFDLPMIFLDKQGNEVEDSNIVLAGRYFPIERRIGFPAGDVKFEVDVVAHEIAHHIDHGRVVVGGDGHDETHSGLADEIEELCRELAASLR